MDLSDCPYFVLHKRLLSCVGLWPYQSKLKNRCIFTANGILVVTAVIPIVLGMLSELSNDFIVLFETFVITVVIFGGLMQISVYFIRGYLVRQLYKRIDEDWQMITDARELKILKKFSEEGRILIIIYIVTSCSAYFLIFIINYAPLAIDQKLFLNYTKIAPCYSSWIIDSSTDFTRNIQIITHSSIGFVITLSAYVVTTAMYICSVKHTCGMFAIIGYRLSKLLLRSNEIITFKKEKPSNDVNSELLTLVKIHQKTLSGIHLIKEIFNIIFFLTVVFQLFCLGMLLFDLKYNIKNTRLLLRMLLAVEAFSIHGFYVNYGGEQIKYYSSKIHSITYFADWYVNSIKVQKVVLTIMQKSTRPDYLRVGIFVLSMQNFATILKASWSAATLLLTMHQKEE